MFNVENTRMHFTLDHIYSDKDMVIEMTFGSLITYLKGLLNIL